MIEFLLNNPFIMAVIAFGIIMIPAIIIHELGHFVAAKLVGINVLEFGIGFPPRVVRLFMVGETEFTLNWLPLGGFVRPLGEDMIGPKADEEDDYSYPDDSVYDQEKPKKHMYITEREELLARGVPEEKLMSVNDAKPLPRIFFMVAGALFNVISAILVFIIAALIGIPIEVGARVQLVEIPANSIFQQAPVEVGDAIELINGEYFQTRTEFFELWQAFSDETVILTMRHPDDEDGNPGEAYELSVRPNVSGIQPYVMISAIIEDGPAQKAGLLAGDLIVAIGGQPLVLDDPIMQVQSATDEAAGRDLTFSILRDGERIDIVVVPRVKYPANQGRVGIGITAIFETSSGEILTSANPQIEYIPQSPGDAVIYGFSRTWTTLRLIASIPMQIIEGKISPEQARPVSIVGISRIGGEFLQRSIRQGSPVMVLEFVSLISIFLGITNLLPLPALDGGRIVFVLIEMVRGKPISRRIESRIHYIGFALLLGLGLIVIIYDIINPITGF